MALMTWTPEMSVGVHAFDEDHKKLIALVNDLHEGVMSGHRKEVLNHVLTELVRYTREHFGREEALFARTGYPAGAAHRKEHDELTQKAVALLERFKEGGGAMLSMETMTFLKDWLAHHILTVDKAYSSHFNSHGVR